MADELTRNVAVGLILRRLRKQAGLSGRQAAVLIHRSPSLLSMWENGHQEIDINILRSLVGHVYKAPPDVLAEVEEIWETPLVDGQWLALGDELAQQFRAYLAFESIATRLEAVGLEVIPGIVQSESYARMLHQQRASMNAEQIDRSVKLRIGRRDRLQDMTMLIVVSEAALHRCAAIDECDQAEQLIALSDPPRVAIQVLPFSAGLHDCVSQYNILRLPTILPELIYQETTEFSVLTELSDKHRTRHADLLRRSLSPSESIKMIEEFTR